MNLPPPAEAALLDARHLHLDADQTLLLNDCSVQVRAGELVGLIGANGAGKTSLLKCLAGLTKPRTGEILLQGERLNEMTIAARALFSGYLEQHPQTVWPLSVEQIVALGRLPHRNALSSDSGSAALIEAALTHTDTLSLQHRMFTTLSAGEQLLVHIARVIVAQTRLILADEPTAALDPWHQWQIMAVLQDLCSQGKGMMVVMHDLSLAARFCSRLILMEKGRIIASGTASEVLTPELMARCYRIDAHFDAATCTVVHTRNLPGSAG